MDGNGRTPEGESGDERIRMPWSRSERAVPRLIVRPLQQFLETEAAGGILLLGATLAALIWANLPDSGYASFWGREVTVSLSRWGLHMSLRDLIDEGLMTLFFFVVGLEIKRELTTGELRDRRATALPVAAALGGMIAPAAIYLAFNIGGAGERGWGIPMATDIAFAVGVLTLAGTGLPSGLKSFLLALAIVDDIGAILVIAIFYSHGVQAEWLTAAAAVLAVMGLAHRVHVRAMAVYAVLGLLFWLMMFESGIHATIAGVILGLLAPSVAFQRPAAVSAEAHRIADETVDDPWPPDADAPQWLRLAELSREAVSPLARLESLLHPWTSFLIVPLFALANAGVAIGGGSVREALRSPIAAGIVLGLVVGKTVGIAGGAWLATRLRMAALPREVRWAHIVAVAVTAGIGFTVSLFVTNVAFPAGSRSDAAKTAILFASVVAGLGGAFFLRRVSRRG